MAAPSTIQSLDRTVGSLGAWIGIVLLFAFFGVFVLVLTAVSPRGDNYEAKRAKAREEKLKTAREEANRDLHSYAWVDKSKGVARIPIDRAMQLALADLAQKKPAPANPIAAPSPAAGQSPAGSPAAAAQQPAATQTGATAPSATPSAPPQKSVTPKPTSVTGVNSELRGQPAAAANPPGAQPGTQPGASTTPAATPGPAGGQPGVSPAGTPVQSPPGSPLPVRGKTPP